MSLNTWWKAAIGSGVVALCLAAVLVAPVTATSRLSDRLGRYSVVVEVDGVDLGQFASVDGLSISQEVIEYRSGNEPNVVRKVPGDVSYGNLTLKRGIVRGDYMWDWLQASFDPDGAVVRKNGSLTVLDRRGREVTRYNFYNAWPAKWTGPTLNADGNDVAIEEIVLAVEGFDEEPPPES